MVKILEMWECLKWNEKDRKIDMQKIENFTMDQ